MSSTTVGGINVAITASTQSFEKGIKKARGLAAGFTKSLSGLTSGLGGLTAALTGVASVAGLKATFDNIEHIGKASQRLGISAKSVRVFQVAADEAEVSFSALTGGMQKLGISVEKALGGDKAKTSAFEKLGIDARSLRMLAPEEQLRKISAAFGQLRSPGQQAQVAMDLFGKSGLSMIGVLKDADGALAEAETRVSKYGGTLTGSGIKAVMAANDAFDDLKMAVTGFGTELAVQLAGPMQKMAEWVLKLTKAIKDYKEVAGGVGLGAGAAMLGGAGARNTTLSVGAFTGGFALGEWAKSVDPEGVKKFKNDGRAVGNWLNPYTGNDPKEDAAMRARMAAAAKFDTSPVAKLAGDGLTVRGSLHGMMSQRIMGKFGTGSIKAGDIASAIGGAISKSSLGRTAGQLGGAALGGLQQAHHGASNFMNFSMPGIMARLQTDQLNRNKGGQSIGYRGISASDPMSREGFAQRVRSLGQGSGGNVAQNHLKEAKKQSGLLEKMANRQNVTISPAPL